MFTHLSSDFKMAAMQAELPYQQGILVATCMSIYIYATCNVKKRFASLQNAKSAKELRMKVYGKHFMTTCNNSFYFKHIVWRVKMIFGRQKHTWVCIYFLSKI